MTDLDFDADGTVSLDEWKRGGLTTIPLLVLLGLDTTVKDDGSHVHFAKGRHCNICMKQLVGLGKQGLGCVFCKYTVHAKCVSRAPASCIFTYTKSKRPAPGRSQSMQHHWTEGNCVEKCAKCRKSIKSGITVRWCKVSLHNKCAEQWTSECDLGASAKHVLPPHGDLPAVLDRGRPAAAANERPPQQPVRRVAAGPAGLLASSAVLQLPDCAPSGWCPLLVFINPKSGGKQGVRILHKMQYLLNPPPACYDLVKDGGPYIGLNFFRELPQFRILRVRRRTAHGGLAAGGIMDKFELGRNRPPGGRAAPGHRGMTWPGCLRWGGGYENESLEKNSAPHQPGSASTSPSPRRRNHGDAAEAGEAGSGAWGGGRGGPGGGQRLSSQPADEIPPPSSTTTSASGWTRPSRTGGTC
uniref:DAG kinase n=1 Tax=Macrostomum lignano TaxID=282301 RepID=A0A1I8FFD1_9PLAT